MSYNVALFLHFPSEQKQISKIFQVVEWPSSIFYDN